MKVLTIAIDVSNMSQEDIDELQLKMESQTEDYDNGVILNSEVRDLTEDDLYEDDDSTLH